MTLIPGEDSENVKLGKTCIMEITILNDDGRYFHITLITIQTILNFEQSTEEQCLGKSMSL